MTKLVGALVAVVLVSGGAIASPMDVCPAQVAYNQAHAEEIKALTQFNLSDTGGSDTGEQICIRKAMLLKVNKVIRAGLDLCQDQTGEYASASAQMEAARLKLVGDLRRDRCAQAE